MLRKAIIAVATSIGVAIGSFGAVTAPAAAAVTMVPSMSAPVSTEAPVIQVKHKKWHKHRRHWSCHVVWVKKKVWRHHHWVWIKVPVRRCGWIWGWW
jgi:hypothetical protein